MRFVSIRELRDGPGQVWRRLSHEQEMVVTSNGKPVALLSAVSEDTLEGTLAALRRARALEAVQSLQAESVRTGRNKMSLREINAEIRAARKSRGR